MDEGMSVLIIGDPGNPHVRRLQNQLQDSKEEVIVFREIGRCISPPDRESRMHIEEEGQRGQQLAGKAKKVYLVRKEKVEQIK